MSLSPVIVRVDVDPQELAAAREHRRANMRERAWIHDRAACLERRVELLGIIRDQARAAKDGAPPCACCEFLPTFGWRSLYRCFECDLWLCPACARAHFAGGDRAR
jgi:hypothetical protein